MRKFFVILLVFYLTFILSGCFTGPQEPAYVFLERPTGLNFDLSTRTLSWNAVSHADNYQVDYWVQIQQKQLTTRATSVTYQISDITPAEDVDIVPLFFHVRAVEYTRGNTIYSSNDQNYSEISFTNVRWVQLETPEDIDFNRETGRLSWDAVENAENYIVRYTTPSTSEPVICPQTANTYYNFGNTFNGITPVSFAVQACSTDQYYRISALPNRWYESRIALSKPVISTVTPTDGYVKIEWYPVPNVSYYNVSYSVRYTSGSINSYSNIHVENTWYQLSTNSVSSITITVYAYAAGYGYWSSDSTSYTLNF